MPIYLLIIAPILDSKKKEELKETLKGFKDYFDSNINLAAIEAEAKNIKSILPKELKDEMKKLKQKTHMVGIPIRLSSFLTLEDFDMVPEHKQKEH